MGIWWWVGAEALDRVGGRFFWFLSVGDKGTALV